MEMVSFKMVGDWRKQMHTTLSAALSVSVDVFHRNAGEACKHAVILMAQSLSSKGNPITPIAIKKREIKSDSKGEYVERWKQGWSSPQKIYKWYFHTSNARYTRGQLSQVGKYLTNIDESKWERAQIVKGRGLARRSWMWGLAAWGGKEEGSTISGTSEVLFNSSSERVEAIKRNKLGYITKIMPAGWAAEAANRATNKIMAQAARKMEKQFISTLRGGNSLMAQSVSSFFLPEAA